MMDDYLSRKEGIILRKLYISQYKKKWFGVKSGCMNDFVAEIVSDDISDSYVRTFLKKLVDNKVLIFHTIKDNVSYYYVDKKKTFDIISEDYIFKLDKEIMDEEYMLIE